MPRYLGTKTGLASLPGLLISTLQQVQDPPVQTALREIQNWANSVGAVNGITGTGSALLGSNFPGATAAHPATWTTVSLNGVAAYIPVWT